jgi:hypothetical protein
MDDMEIGRPTENDPMNFTDSDEEDDVGLKFSQKIIAKKPET